MEDPTKQKKRWTAWTNEETNRFVQLLPELKQQYTKYMPYFPNRNYSQVKSFYHNLQRKQAKQQDHERVGRTPRRIQLSEPESTHSYTSELMEELLQVFKKIDIQ